MQIKTPFSIRLGVVGGGTMGSGIALTALLAGMLVSLYDVSDEMLGKAQDYTRKHLERKGREISLKNLELTTDLENLAGCGVVIEAIPEDLSLKEALFKRLDEICPPPVILATNTSTLPVTALAAATAHPERVAGMHFFNPAPVLPLVEVVRGAQTSPETVRTLQSLAEKLGKSPVIAKDTPGFIVNRVARPFYGEALRLLGEGVAGAAEIDRLVRMGGGFRMGPFELMDLIGIDINLAAMQSMYEQTFGEPRYRPQQVQVRMVQQRALGRKTGRGFYDYETNPPGEDPKPPRISRQKERALLSPGSWAPGLQDLLRQAGYSVSNGGGAGEPPVIGIAAAGREEDLRRHLVQLDRSLPPGAPLMCQVAGVTLIEVATWVRRPEHLVGFDGLFFANGPAANLVASPTLTPASRAAAERFVRSLGRLPVWTSDSPALVLPRILCMLSNEAAFALGEGVADLATIDKAMQLGTNYPKGPLAWAKELGYHRVVAVLDHLHAEYGEERYRVAPLLRRWDRLEQIIA